MLVVQHDEGTDWTQLAEEWKSFSGNQTKEKDVFLSKLSASSMKGVPEKERQWVWPALLSKQLACVKVSYEDLIVGIGEFQIGHVSLLEGNLILQDISRMQKLSQSQKSAIYRILSAYEKINTQMQHIHGMADVCSILLLYMDEETAFLTLRVIVEILLPEYHVKSMVGFHADCQVLQYLLDVNNHSLSIHLQKLGLSMDVVCTMWFFSIHVASTPKNIALHVLDILFAEAELGAGASKIVLAVALSILMYLSSALQRLEDASSCLQAINTFCREALVNYTTSKQFIQICDTLYLTLSDEVILKLRLNKKKDVLEKFSAFAERKRNTRRVSIPKDDNLLGSKSGVNRVTITPRLIPYTKLSRIGSILIRRRTSSASEISPYIFSPKTYWLNLKQSILSNQFPNDSKFYANIVKESYCGIPDDHRSWLWTFLLSEQCFKMQDRSEEYSVLVSMSHEQNLVEIENEIDKDIMRTPFLREEFWGSLRRILVAYGYKNPEIGYCQGMNILVALLLRYMDEEDAFWSFSTILKELLPDYYVPTMIGLHVDCAVIQTLLAQIDISLVHHFKLLGVNMQVLCTKWLVTCFITCLPEKYSLQIFDMLLLHTKDGVNASKILLGCAISILFNLSEDLQKQEDICGVLSSLSEYLQQLNTNSLLGETFLDLARRIIAQLDNESIEQFRAFYRGQVTQEFADFEVKRSKLRSIQQDSMMAKSESDSSFVKPKKKRSSYTFGAMKRAILVKKKDISTKKEIPTSLPDESTEDCSSQNKNSEGSSTSPQDITPIQEIIHMGEQLGNVSDLYDKGKITDEEQSKIKQRIFKNYGNLTAPVSSSQESNRSLREKSQNSVYSRLKNTGRHMKKKLRRRKNENDRRSRNLGSPTANCLQSISSDFHNGDISHEQKFVSKMALISNHHALG